MRDGKILDGIKMPTEIYEPKDGLAIGIGMIPYPMNYRIAFAGPWAKLIPKKIVVENIFSFQKIFLWVRILFLFMNVTATAIRSLLYMSTYIYII